MKGDELTQIQCLITVFVHASTPVTSTPHNTVLFTIVFSLAVLQQTHIHLSAFK